MNSKDSRVNRLLALLIIPSFLVLTCAVVLRVGIGATAYNATDSTGRAMGFNDPLYFEHYLTILRNFSPAELLKFEYAYEWVLLAMQVVGAAILLLSGLTSARLACWYFIAQAALFPFAVPAMFVLPSYATSLFMGHLDRESFIDVPFIWITAQPVWVFISVLIAWLLRRACAGGTTDNKSCL